MPTSPTPGGQTIGSPVAALSQTACADRPKLPKPLLVFWWAVTVAWTVVIFVLSTHSFGSDYTQSFLARLLASVRLQVSLPTLHFLNVAIRKVAHLSEYGILALFLYGPPEQGRVLWKPRRAIFAVAAAGLYSLTDEFHQIFVPGRGASLWDCGLDTLGASLAMLLPFCGHQLRLLRQTRTVSGM